MAKCKRNHNKAGRTFAGNIPAVRNYKDTVFRMLFSDRKNLLSLYNAVNQKAYQNPDDLEIVTLDVDECIQEGILADFLSRNRAEVISMSIFEYDKELEEKKLRKAEYEVGFAEGEISGHKAGFAEAAKETARRMLSLHEFTPEKIAVISGLTLEEVLNLQNSIEK